MRLDNIRGVALQQPHARAAQSVFRQQADHVEKRRADFIVQIFRRQFFLSWLAQADHNVRTKLSEAAGLRNDCRPFAELKP